jgi:Ca-activated chloride channel family protein
MIELNLRGSYLGQQRNFAFSFDLGKATTRNAFVPRLWASRRIAQLVDEVRQAGALSSEQPSVAGGSIFDDPRFAEIADEILRLSTEFGILTEYTSFLATEGTNLANWNELRLGCGTTLNERAVRVRTGGAAVNQALNYNDSKMQTVLKNDNRYWDANLTQVEITSVQQVCDRAFFNRGGCWIDGRLVNEQTSEIVADEEVMFGSEAHRRILDALIAEGRQAALSLPGEILIRYEGKNVLIKQEQREGVQQQQQQESEH